MKKSNVVRGDRPEAAPKDLLTEIARDGARQMLATALEIEVEAFINLIVAHKFALDTGATVAGEFL
jgi:hypothetical protein